MFRELSRVVPSKRTSCPTEDNTNDTGETRHYHDVLCKYFLVPRPLYPASSRLLSVPPRYYDIIDTDTNEVIDSDLHRRANRSRSVARNSELRDGWRHPGYNDLVVGSKAHPGNYYPR